MECASGAMAQRLSERVYWNKTDGLEAIGRRQTIELLPGVPSVHVDAGRHEGRIRSGLGGGALSDEVADRALVRVAIPVRMSNCE